MDITQPRFIECDGVVIATRHIILVDFREEEVTISMTNGQIVTAKGVTARSLRAFFLPQAIASPSEPDPAACGGLPSKAEA